MIALHEAIAAGAESCAHCGGFERLVVDHKVARERGGGNDPENLHVLCHWCNSSKGALDWDEWKARDYRPF